MTMNDALMGAAVLWLLYMLCGIPGRTGGPGRDRRVAHRGQRGSQHRPLFGVVSGSAATAARHPPLPSTPPGIDGISGTTPDNV